MPRKPRELVPGGIYHVFARGNRRQEIFVDDADRETYLRLWGSTATETRWRCLAYCLMDNHVHHIVETPEPNLTEGVQLAHSAYARLFNERHGKSGHTFQGRFGSTRARSDGVLWYFVAYVVLNPVRAGLCDRADRYSWSSHRAVVGAASRPRWLDVPRLLSFYDPDCESALEQYRLIVETIAVMGAAGFEPATSRV